MVPLHNSILKITMKMLLMFISTLVSLMEISWLWWPDESVRHNSHCPWKRRCNTVLEELAGIGSSVLLSQEEIQTGHFIPNYFL